MTAVLTHPDVSRLQAQLDAQKKELSSLREDVSSLHARIEGVEGVQQTHATELSEIRMRLGALQSGVDRVLDEQTKQSLTLASQGKAIAKLGAASADQTVMLQQIHSTLSDIARHVTPKVTHG